MNVKIDDNKSIDLLITGFTQGVKVKYKYDFYMTISKESPIAWGIIGKKVGEITTVLINGFKKNITILSVK